MANEKINWPAPSAIEWDPRKATLRNEPRVMIRVDVLPYNGQDIGGGGGKLKAGRQFALVYESALPAIRKMAPTAEERARLVQAQAGFDARMAAHIETCGGKLPAAIVGTPAGDAQMAAAVKMATDTAGFSVAGEYHQLANRVHDRSPVRAYPPIDGLEIREGFVVDPPVTPEGLAEKAARSTENALAGAIDRLAAIMGGNQKKTA